MKQPSAEEFTMVAKTMAGLEEVLAGELLSLGARDIKPGNRMVSFTGDKVFMYKANFNLRTALRILKPIATFEAANENMLYQKIQHIDWSQYVDESGTLMVDSTTGSEVFTHSQYVSLKVKDAIVDQFREKKGTRPSVDLAKPDLKINIHISGTRCTVSLDSSGESLHKRGYRGPTGAAPISEVLAAGMVILSNWDKRSPLVDPMCGSGTILIEAALYSLNVPPGYFREKFGFESWKDFDPELWELIRTSSLKRIKDHDLKLYGADLDENVLDAARANITAAQVDDSIVLKKADFNEYEPPVKRGVMILNPPYGERLEQEDMVQFYKSIGDVLKRNYSGIEAFIISSNLDALKFIGLRPSRKHTLYNGPLECRFNKYELYSGSKKASKTH